jgi:hypothetical protein
MAQSCEPLPGKKGCLLDLRAFHRGDDLRAKERRTAVDAVAHAAIEALAGDHNSGSAPLGSVVPGSALGNKLYGNWWGVSLGRWVIIGGKGSYRELAVTRTSVFRVSATLASKRHGISAGVALMADGRDVRFRVIARDPVTVRTTDADAEPGDVEAIEAWFAAQGREA